MPQDAPNVSSPGPARGAAIVLAVQAAALAVGSVVLAVSGFAPDAVDRTGAEILALIGLASAVGIALLARGVARGRRGVGSPVLVLELICLPIAYTVITNDHVVPGLLLGASALVVLVLLAAAGQLARRD
jgi:hypothetical protein